MINSDKKSINSDEDIEKTSWFLILTGEKWPWIQKSILFISSIMLLPFRNILNKTNGGNVGYMGKLIRLHRYQEGYLFGLEQLSRLSAKLQFVPKNPKSFWEFGKASNPMMWCYIFNLTCDCAAEINEGGNVEILESLYEQNFGILKDISTSNVFYEKLPFGKALGGLARLSWCKKSPEAGWEWVNKAIESEKTNGYSYYLRAWMGEKMGIGQPIDDLILAINNEPGIEKMIFEDKVFLNNEALLSELKERLERPN